MRPRTLVTRVHIMRNVYKRVFVVPPTPRPGHTPVYKLAGPPRFLAAPRLYPETDFDGRRLTITAASTFAPVCTRVTTGPLRERAFVPLQD